MKRLFRILAILTVILPTTRLLAQPTSDDPIVLRTFASEIAHRMNVLPEDPERSYWAFVYNDAGELDSMSHSGQYGQRQLGGLSRLKPFVKEMYDWYTLPPNRGRFPYHIFASLRLVLTEDEPGKIRIIETSLQTEDSLDSPDTIKYDYDTATGRVLQAGGYFYSYEDSAGYIIRITQHSRTRRYAVWDLYRNSEGVIARIEYKTANFRNDSLRGRGLYRRFPGSILITE